MLLYRKTSGLTFVKADLGFVIDNRRNKNLTVWLNAITEVFETLSVVAWSKTRKQHN
jgi:hypothetical protein